LGHSSAFNSGAVLAPTLAWIPSPGALENQWS
jgi:hypothetical protein